MKFTCGFFMSDHSKAAKDSGLTRALERIDRRISDDLRALRQARSLTLAQLSEKVGRSVGWLSQVERGLSMPSLPDLRRMASIMNVPFSFFEKRVASDDPEVDIVVRAGARRILHPAETDIEDELLSPSLGGSFEMRRRRLAPGADMTVYPPRGGEEAGFVIAGSLTVEADGKACRVSAGDSFRLKGKTLSWRNESDEDAIVVWVLSPPVY